jgi:hypothetical protein
MKISEVLDHDVSQLLDLYYETRESSKWITSQYDKLIQELIDEGYDIKDIENYLE